MTEFTDWDFLCNSSSSGDYINDPGFQQIYNDLFKSGEDDPFGFTVNDQKNHKDDTNFDLLIPITDQNTTQSFPQTNQEHPPTFRQPNIISNSNVYQQLIPVPTPNNYPHQQFQKINQMCSSTFRQTDIISNSNGYQPLTTVSIQNNYALQPIQQINQVYPSTFHQANIISKSNGYQPLTTAEQQTRESGTERSKQITIISPPRPEIHPRNSKESEKASHFVRCEEGAKHAYPTVSVDPNWNKKGIVNYMEVALMDIYDELHPYIVDNKEKGRNSTNGQSLILRRDKNAENKLCFRLTDKDFTDGFKILKFELIKRTLSDSITKKLIAERQLYQSKLRFRRIYQVENGDFQEDEITTVYSCVIKENSGNVSVKHVTPVYGPMSGNQPMVVGFTSLQPKDRIKLSFKFSEETSNWSSEVGEFDSNGNTIRFLTPAFPRSQMTCGMAKVTIYYEQQELHQSPYLYVHGLDQILTNFNLSPPTNVNTPSTTKTSKTKPVKRLCNKRK